MITLQANHSLTWSVWVYQVSLTQWSHALARAVYEVLEINHLIEFQEND